MCHPAFVDWYLWQNSSYNFDRARELALICSQEVKEMVQDIILINYSQIQKISFDKI